MSSGYPITENGYEECIPALVSTLVLIVRNILFLAVFLSVLPTPAFSQKLEDGRYYPNLTGQGAGSESNSGSGSGAGWGSNGPGVPNLFEDSSEAVTRSYKAGINPDLTPQQALQQQNRTIQIYTTMGYQLEAKKQWENSEKALKYVLKVSAIRDGVGSPKMIPVIQHLVNVTAARQHLPEAIGFQERVLAFAKNQPDPLPIINAGVALSNLYIKHQDNDKAEATIQETLALSQSTTSIPEAKKQEVTHAYETVMQKIHGTIPTPSVDPLSSAMNLNPGGLQEAKSVDKPNDKTAASTQGK